MSHHQLHCSDHPAAPTTALDVYIVGAGGHGRVCAEIAEAMGHRVVGFIDQPRSADERINGTPILFTDLGGLARAKSQKSTAVFIAVSGNQQRLTLIEDAEKLGLPILTLIHPSAVISRTCSIGVGSVVMPGSIINANARLGRGCILNTAASVDHDCVVDDGAQIAPGVHAASNVHFGARSFTGTGASIKQCIRIGTDAFVGVGAVVVRDVDQGATVVGNPAKTLKPRT